MGKLTFSEFCKELKKVSLSGDVRSVRWYTEYLESTKDAYWFINSILLDLDISD